MRYLREGAWQFGWAAGTTKSLAKDCWRGPVPFILHSMYPTCRNRKPLHPDPGIASPSRDAPLTLQTLSTLSLFSLSNLKQFRLLFKLH